MAGIPDELIAAIRAQYTLDWRGTHGWPHWLRVRDNGLRLAASTGADVAVVEMFAVLHDAARRNDGHDPGHGARGAALLDALPAGTVTLDEAQFELLRDACRRHTDGVLEADVTVQTCWDADRLDLGRVGIAPDPAQLCTAAARDPLLLAWALGRSRSRLSLDGA